MDIEKEILGLKKHSHNGIDTPKLRVSDLEIDIQNDENIKSKKVEPAFKELSTAVSKKQDKIVSKNAFVVTDENGLVKDLRISEVSMTGHNHNDLYAKSTDLNKSVESQNQIKNDLLKNVAEVLTKIETVMAKIGSVSTDMKSKADIFHSHDSFQEKISAPRGNIVVFGDKGIEDSGETLSSYADKDSTDSAIIEIRDALNEIKKELQGKALSNHSHPEKDYTNELINSEIIKSFIKEQVKETLNKLIGRL